MQREIIPTRKERTEWKEMLRNSLLIICEYYPDLYPRKRDSFETLLEKFFYWASEYNEGYFGERDDADTDRYCAYLVQQYDAMGY